MMEHCHKTPMSKSSNRWDFLSEGRKPKVHTDSFKDPSSVELLSEIDKVNPMESPTTVLLGGVTCSQTSKTHFWEKHCL